MDLSLVRTLCSIATCPQDVISLLSTCKKYYPVATEDVMWKEFYHKYFENDFRVLPLLQEEPLTQKRLAFSLFLKSFTPDDESRSWRQNFEARYTYEHHLKEVMEEFPNLEPVAPAHDDTYKTNYHAEIAKEIEREGYKVTPYGDDTDFKQFDVDLSGLIYYGMLHLTYKDMIEWAKIPRALKKKPDSKEESSSEEISQPPEPESDPSKRERRKQVPKKAGAPAKRGGFGFGFGHQPVELPKHSPPTPDLLYCIDIFHFTQCIHPHVHLHKCLQKASTEEIDTEARKVYSVFDFLSDNIEWSPAHRKWGFYSNYCGEVLMWGELMDFIHQKSATFSSLFTKTEAKNFKQLTQ